MRRFAIQINGNYFVKFSETVAPHIVSQKDPVYFDQSVALAYVDAINPTSYGLMFVDYLRADGRTEISHTPKRIKNLALEMEIL
jgi:hypothetical protein